MNNIHIRDESAQDHEGIRHMHRLAFGSPGTAKLADDLRESHEAVISLVALNGEMIVGHVMLSRLKASEQALTLAPLAVHPDFQRRGLGFALIQKALERAKQEGWTAVFVVGDTGYYERAGFHISPAKGVTSPFGGEVMVVSLDTEKTA